jgi:hypothetical protein
MHVHDLPGSPREHWRQIPASLEQLLAGMLAKAPSQRPSLAAVTRTLDLVADELLRGSDPVLVPDDSERKLAPALDAGVTLPARRARPRPWPVTAGLALAAVAATGAVGGQQERVTVPPTASEHRGHASATLAAAPDDLGAATQPEPLFDRTAFAALASGARLATAPLVDIMRASVILGASITGATVRRPLIFIRRPAVNLRPAAVRHTAARAATPPAAAAPDPDATPAALVDQYVSLGRDLARQRAVVDVSDLWSRYRLVRIYEAVATAAQRRSTSSHLAQIRADLTERIARVEPRGEAWR